MNPEDNSGVTGVVKFEESVLGRTVITAEIKGLKPGEHTMRIHQFAGILNAGHKSVGAHIGEFGAVKANQDGVAKFVMETDHVRLHGPKSVIGRSFVVGNYQARGIIVHSKPHAKPNMTYAIS